ncbi:metallophosphoesterase [Noviherbaspirillum malthae]|nr:metallophosphoesterase [Noviherbaspirillum malthae]
MLIQSFTRNTRGRDLIVGDVHGCFSALQAHLDVLGFDPEVERLFCTGDLVDRGAESDLAKEWLSNKPWFYTVRGNHEA